MESTETPNTCTLYDQPCLSYESILVLHDLPYPFTPKMGQSSSDQQQEQDQSGSEYPCDIDTQSFLNDINTKEHKESQQNKVIFLEIGRNPVLRKLEFPYCKIFQPYIHLVEFEVALAFLDVKSWAYVEKLLEYDWER